jgi:hypothetical protein
MFTDTVCRTDSCAHSTTAQIVHSVSTTGVLGPYQYKALAIPSEIENIHAARTAPTTVHQSSTKSSIGGDGGDGGEGDGDILLYYGDHDFVFPNATCTGDNKTLTTGPTTSGTLLRTGDGGNPYPRHTKRMGISHAASFSGPWTKFFPSYDESMKPFLPLVNPSPLVLRNGSVLLAFRYQPAGGKPETNGLAFADTWRGPYRLVSSAAAPVPEASEDPFLFENHRGLHMIFHCYRGTRNPPNLTGCHAYSGNGGVSWSVSPNPVYTTTVPMANGTTVNFNYRERPEILFDPGSSTAAETEFGGNTGGSIRTNPRIPRFLLTGVETGIKSNDYPNCASISIATVINA